MAIEAGYLSRLNDVEIANIFCYVDDRPHTRDYWGLGFRHRVEKIVKEECDIDIWVWLSCDAIAHTVYFKNDEDRLIFQLKYEE